MNRPRVTIHVDGTAVEVDAWSTVAVALLQVRAGRTAVDGSRREAVCGMGICWECRATVDAVDDVRTCLVPVHEGMQVQTHA